MAHTENVTIIGRCAPQLARFLFYYETRSSTIIISQCKRSATASAAAEATKAAVAAARAAVATTMTASVA